jgi:hypothetical protein
MIYGREDGAMLDNNTYNLMEQIVQESKSLWRIRNSYLKDAGSCSECAEFWRKLADDKEKHIKDLEKLIASHTSVVESARR